MRAWRDGTHAPALARRRVCCLCCLKTKHKQFVGCKSPPGCRSRRCASPASPLPPKAEYLAHLTYWEPTSARQTPVLVAPFSPLLKQAPSCLPSVVSATAPPWGEKRQGRHYKRLEWAAAAVRPQVGGRPTRSSTAC